MIQIKKYSVFTYYLQKNSIDGDTTHYNFKQVWSFSYLIMQKKYESMSDLRIYLRGF